MPEVVSTDASSVSMKHRRETDWVIESGSFSRPVGAQRTPSIKSINA